MEFLLFLILVVLVMSAMEKKDQPDVDPNLHRHVYSGWHSHPRDPSRGPHYHTDENNLDGPFVYVDEEIIDQRNEEH